MPPTNKHKPGQTCGLQGWQKCENPTNIMSVDQAGGVPNSITPHYLTKVPRPYRRRVDRTPASIRVYTQGASRGCQLQSLSPAFPRNAVDEVAAGGD